MVVLEKRFLNIFLVLSYEVNSNVDHFGYICTCYNKIPRNSQQKLHMYVISLSDPNRYKCLLQQIHVDEVQNSLQSKMIRVCSDLTQLEVTQFILQVYTSISGLCDWKRTSCTCTYSTNFFKKVGQCRQQNYITKQITLMYIFYQAK